ncbi:OLC1v1002993C1 [Oldenlandia corymbosa var. corymbosa]|uniref:Autophagy-related protein 2 n=1 Tax=Oldenlandia corymbosa var. corymbosa TaxID=529605 RepID=A0AAV1D912_OLDCO|nr:OLC1v1002993C1 [Oldenlandia corymbosa var. corymbosa]
MFPWNIAKSAEAMFSRWAIKRVCKFLLKKKLGKFILGDVDLNQLDVQLSAGTVQLNDLALNVDYINQKFGANTTVIVKEGSIGSLMLTLPWRGDGCGIVVDELELVIAPCGENVFCDGSETCTSAQENNSYANHVSGRAEKEVATDSLRSTSVEVHEGVKTIANMVKWLLSSFQVTVKKLIVAFDPCTIEKKSSKFCRTLVLRIAEVQCGTSISEDAHLINGDRDNIIGLSRLTNFVKFQGAVLEFLQIDDVQEQAAYASDTTFSEWFSHCCQSTAMTPIITGKDGGFSGSLKLSIPWQNGSLDIRQVDADAYVDPLKLYFQPSTALCIMYLWRIFKDTGSSGVCQMLSKTTDSVCDNAASTYHSTMQAPDSLNSDVVVHGNDKSVLKCSSFVAEDCRPKALLSESHLISDWIGRSQKDTTYVEPDFGASVDQFFECLDELRSSQSALGNSGVWKWTSYISALTAATNLASGSLHKPAVQQHVETNFKVNIAHISLLFSFFDEEFEYSCPTETSAASAGHKSHYLEMNIWDLLLLFRVCPKEMNLEATIHHVELDDHFSSLEIDPKSQVDFIRRGQEAIQDAITPSSVPGGRAGVSKNKANEMDHPMDNAVNVSLLKTSGISRCQVTVDIVSSERFVLGPISFTLKLPPFVFWANVSLLSEVSNVLKELGSHEMVLTRMNESISASDHVSSTSTTESLRGNIILESGRIMLMEDYSSFDQLISLDFSSPVWDHNAEASQPARASGAAKGYSLQKTRSLNLSWGTLSAYLITSDPEENVGIGTSGIPNFFAQNFLSISDGNSRFSTVNISWQDGASTGPWITKRAKLLATAENLKNGDRFMGKDCECTSVTNVKGMKDFEKHARQAIVLSSGFLVHAQFSPVVVRLGKAEYDSLIHFLHKLIDCLPPLASDSVNEVTTLSQGSILVDCDSVEIAISMDGSTSEKSPLQKELSGSWHSFRLKVQKFQLLSVSNIGGIENASFLWVSHGDGSLWGSVTGVSREELLLISCCNSARGRGDGQGSNLLSPRLSGSDIVHFWDPVDLHSYMSIVVSCGTVVATGGRVDWWDTLSSFFTLSSRDLEEAGDNNLPKEDSERSSPSTTSFVLNLVDVGLCYEPYFCDYAIDDGSDAVSPSTSMNKIVNERYFACLLAASSFTISNTSVCNSSVGEYEIRVQDLGLLLCPVSDLKLVGASYNVKNLSKFGHVKVAHVARIEALLRIFSKEEEPAWEVESPGLDIVINTCSDTTSGLVRLGAQLQQLFAPDIEDALIHLQSRWNNVQEANGDAENGTVSDEAPLSDSEGYMGMQGNQCTGNLMEEISEDAFQLVGKSVGQSDCNDADVFVAFNDNILGEPSSISAKDGENFAGCFPFSGTVPFVGFEKCESSSQHGKVPELIEEYFLSDLRPLSDLAIKSESSNGSLKCRAGIVGNGDVQIRDNGWYGNTIVQILENHISEESNQANMLQVEDSESSSSCTGPEDYAKVKGRVLLKNINVVWRMYGGSDWKNFQKSCDDYSSGRDTTTCLEVLLSGIRIQYDMLPEGGNCVSRLSVSVQDFFLNDNSQNAPWKLVLGYYQSKDRPRKSSAKAFKMDLESVRPDPLTPLEEYRLRVAILPIRLHLHQSQLNFLINFFGGQSLPVKPSDDTTYDMHVGEKQRGTVNVGHFTIIEEALLPYFQKFDIWPVLIRVDYRPSHVDLAALRSGKYVELVNIVPWKGVELQLKHVSSLGIYGWGSVCERVLGEWLEDISQNQIHKLLKGLPPIQSLVAVGSGAKKMFTLPVKNYKKERRLIKGVQRGTIAFMRSVSVEAIGLGVHLAAGAHNILHQVECILASIPPSLPSCPAESRGKRDVRSNQPKDALQGMKQAYGSISGGLSKSASALIRTPLKRYQSGDGIGSALATAVQAAPVAAVAPASATVRAVQYALLGMRNSLDPEHKKESLKKYLGSAPRREFL